MPLVAPVVAPSLRSEAMMRISAKAAYACLAVIELAQSGAVGWPRRVREIAGAQGIPAPYLIHILLRLKAAGLVQSARGAVGGYQLSRDPSKISVGEVIAAIDGRPARSYQGGSRAARRLSEVLERVHAAEQAILHAATIADLARPVAPESPVP